MLVVHQRGSMAGVQYVVFPLGRLKWTSTSSAMKIVGRVSVGSMGVSCESL